MCPKEFEWKDTEYRGAVVPLVREVGRGSVLHATARLVVLRRQKADSLVGIWWIAETPDSEKSRILERCTEALRKWKGLRGYEPRVITARKPYRPTHPRKPRPRQSQEAVFPILNCSADATTFLRPGARTIINTCKRAGTDPVAYVTDVIMKLQRGWPKSRIDELLPDRWSLSDVELAAE